MTERSKIFLDSNISLYALSDEDDAKRAGAEDVIEKNGDRICLFTQVINEVCALNYKVIHLDEEILLSGSDIRLRHSFLFGTA